MFGSTPRRSPRPADLLAAAYALVLVGLAIWVSDPEGGGLMFRGTFIQDADEVIRSWYGRCAFKNAAIIPYSHLSMPGWTLLLALGEQIGRLFGLAFTLPGRLTTVFFSWLLLHNAAAWVRAQGGSERLAVAAVVLIGATPGYLLLSLSVYPSVALAALTVLAARRVAEDRDVAAALVMGFGPLIRWEGVLLVALFLVVFLARRKARAAAILLLPYLAYLGSNALRFGNPWKPLAYRTTRHMGAWLILNPDVHWDRLGPAIRNLVTLYPPIVLPGALLVAAFGALRFPRQIFLMAAGFAGLTVSLLLIQHEWMVWALRVFVTPLCLGLLTVLGVAARVSRWPRRILVAVSALGVAVSAGMAFQKLNNQKIPPPGGFHSEIGFHMFVRYADAAPTLAWIQREAQTGALDYVITGHLNANLLRADPQCTLWDLPLRLGTPKISLGRDFSPIFGLPTGRGLVVTHAAALDVPGCTRVAAFPSRQIILRCEAPELPDPSALIEPP